MMKSVAIASVIASASGAALLKGDDVAPGEYIITLSHSFDRQMTRNHINKLETTFGRERFSLLHHYESLAEEGFVAYSAKLSPEVLDFLLAHDDVLTIEENQMMYVTDCLSQSTPTWGLRRTNIRGSYTAGSYSYTTGRTGKGVYAYIIDSGVYCANVDFTSKTTGTCILGVDYVDGSNVDGNGHGTHVAGTVGGKTYGVAKEATIVAVRVMNNRGSGSTSDIIAGINWSVAQYKSNRIPSVINMSVGGSYSASFNSAAEAAVAANVATIVAAGNSNKNACDYSPASAPSVITVGATDSKDARASYSNYGSCVDIFGPGSAITSAWIGSPTATKTIDGTSMASPHVCGVAAKYLSANAALTSTQINQKLIDDSTKGVISGESGGSQTGTNVSPDRLVYGYCT